MGGHVDGCIGSAGTGSSRTSSSQRLGSSPKQWLKGFGAEKHHSSYLHCTDYFSIPGGSLRHIISGIA